MAYKSLKKLFYMDSSSERFANNKRLAAERLNAESTFRTGMITGEGELFLAVPHELSVLSEQALRKERVFADPPGLYSQDCPRGACAQPGYR